MTGHFILDKCLLSTHAMPMTELVKYIQKKKCQHHALIHLFFTYSPFNIWHSIHREVWL